MPVQYKSYNDPAERLIRVYDHQNFSISETARHFNISEREVIKVLSERGRYPPSNYKNYAAYTVDRRGYPVWRTSYRDESIEVRVHQLLAISEGADPHKVFSKGEYHVHHTNEVPWDNRPDNTEFLSREEHMRIHAKRRSERGLAPETPRKYTDSEMLDWLDLFVEEFGFVPTNKDIHGWPGPSGRTYAKRFGSFTNALKEAGFTPRGER